MSGELTVGQLLIRRALPEDLADRNKNLDKKSLRKLFAELAERHPERYKQVLEQLSDIGREAAWRGGATVSLSGLSRSRAKEEVLAPVRKEVRKIIRNTRLSPEERNRRLIDVVSAASPDLQDALLAEARSEKNPFYEQVVSGARGSAASLSSLRGADLLVTNQRGELVPVPIFSSYGEGLSPGEYFATSFGQRKGQLDVKLAVADAGFLSKQLNNATHRQVVTHEAPPERRLPVGLPVRTSDMDNAGAVLARDAGPFKAGEILTQRKLDKLRAEEVDEVLVHSPITDYSEDGGLSSLAAGKRTKRGLSPIGENIGLSSAQALSERLSQGLLDSKHSAGVGVRVPKSGFEYINRLIQAPENFPEAGPLAEEEAEVLSVDDAPQGGKIVRTTDREYYLQDGLTPVVKPGDHLEPGDDLSDGTPHPSDLVRLRGMGEARRVYTEILGEALKNSGVAQNRRNLESITSGLLNWARVTNPDGLGDNIYDDVVPFNRLAATYVPRSTAQKTKISLARGRYLEEPVLHYTPGTRVTNRVLEDLKKWGIEDVITDENEPDFQPNMVRGVHSVYHDPDWRTRLGGFYTATAFKDSVRRGLTSDTRSTSYVPGVTRGVGFGQDLASTGMYGKDTTRKSLS